MMEGEFVRYFFATSIAVIAGRILGFGAREDLVYRIKHNRKRISYYLRGAVLYYFGAFVSILIAGVIDNKYEIAILTISYSMVIAGSNFLTGALRTYSNVFQELNVNAPWLLVLIFSFWADIHYASDILYLLLFGHGLIFAANLAVAHLVGIEVQRPGFRVLVTQFRRYSSWLPKSLSSAILTADLRSYPIWLGSLGYVVTDGLAYAFVIGELIFQICMVYVHQIHSSLKLQDSFTGMRKLLQAGLVMLVLAIFIPIPVYQIVSSGYFIKAISIEYATMIYASLYCGTWAFFSLMRILVWRNEHLGGAVRVLLLQSSAFLAVGLMVMAIGQGPNLLLIATMLNMIGMSAYMYYLSRNSYV